MDKPITCPEGAVAELPEGLAEGDGEGLIRLCRNG
jgi:hypothetical protein